MTMRCIEDMPDGPSLGLHRLDPAYDKATYETLTMKVTGLAALLFALTAGTWNRGKRVELIYRGEQ